MPKVAPIKFVVGPCRLSYVNIFEPAPPMNPGDEPVRQVSLLFPKTDAKSIALLNQNFQAIAKSALETGVFKTATNMHVPLRDGDAEVDSGNRGEEYRGFIFCNAKSWRPVGVVNGQNQPILDPDELYSGCWANVQISFKTFNVRGKFGIRVEINLIQKVRDDERFDGADKAEDVFQVIDTPTDSGPAIPGVPTIGGATAAPAPAEPAAAPAPAESTPPPAEPPAAPAQNGGGPSATPPPANPFANLV